MKLKILTQDKVILDTEVDSVTLPGSEGEMTLLPQHAAMVVTLKRGTLKYRVAGKSQEVMSVDGGTVEIYKNHVLVLTKLKTPASQTRESNPSHH